MMGTRTVETDDPPQNGQVQVDAGRIIKRLQQQRADLESQLDILAVALEEANERERKLAAEVQRLQEKK